jgi:hypothetical protein
MAQTFQDFDRRGFPGAVGPEQAKDFPELDLESDSPQHLEIPVPFMQAFDVHNRGIVRVRHEAAYDIGQGYPRQSGLASGRTIRRGVWPLICSQRARVLYCAMSMGVPFRPWEVDDLSLRSFSAN